MRFQNLYSIFYTGIKYPFIINSYNFHLFHVVKAISFAAHIRWKPFEMASLKRMYRYYTKGTLNASLENLLHISQYD